MTSWQDLRLRNGHGIINGHRVIDSIITWQNCNPPVAFWMSEYAGSVEFKIVAADVVRNSAMTAGVVKVGMQ